eukprot:TRINITY_DN4334_c0_g1_i1.p1 TRINITY_DN4334_c0_g1~~TRINITY_DN4334_c0_g1_i1.p1  ORF type:complete len:344 (-),score=88.35 TRINITY_DN4334_c0_g1_i1:11-1042(-)
MKTSRSNALINLNLHEVERRMTEVKLVVLWYINTVAKPVWVDSTSREWDAYFQSFTTVPVMVKQGVPWQTSITDIQQMIVDHCAEDEDFPFKRIDQFELALSDEGSFGESRVYLPSSSSSSSSRNWGDNNSNNGVLLTVQDIISQYQHKKQPPTRQWKNLPEDVVVLYIVPPRPPEGNLYFQLLCFNQDDDEEEGQPSSKLLAVQLPHAQQEFSQMSLLSALELMFQQTGLTRHWGEVVQAIVDPSGFEIHASQFQCTLQELGIWKHSVVQVVLNCSLVAIEPESQPLLEDDFCFVKDQNRINQNCQSLLNCEEITGMCTISIDEESDQGDQSDFFKSWCSLL